jgi:2-dehydropantoate 2-reductase
MVVRHPDRETTLSGRVLTEPSSITAPARWVILATKVSDTPGVASWLDALVGSDTTVVVAQNGVEHDLVRPLAPSCDVLPALVYVNVERVNDESIRHHGHDRLVIPATEAGAAFAALFDGTPVSVERVSDFRAAAWRKLLTNVAASPITTVLDCRLGALRAPELEALATDLVAEAVAVAVAEGVALGGQDVAATIASLRSFPSDGSSSMRFDRVAGRPLEHEALTGVIVNRGIAHGVPVPVNQVMLRLLRTIDHAGTGHHGHD